MLPEWLAGGIPDTIICPRCRTATPGKDLPFIQVACAGVRYASSIYDHESGGEYAYDHDLSDADESDDYYEEGDDRSEPFTEDSFESYDYEPADVDNFYPPNDEHREWDPRDSDEWEKFYGDDIGGAEEEQPSYEYADDSYDYGDSTKRGRGIVAEPVRIASQSPGAHILITNCPSCLCIMALCLVGYESLRWQMARERVARERAAHGTMSSVPDVRTEPEPAQCTPTGGSTLDTVPGARRHMGLTQPGADVQSKSDELEEEFAF